MTGYVERGCVRPDGFKFWGYEKRTYSNGVARFREKWKSPAAFDKAVTTQKRCCVEWKKRDAAARSLSRRQGRRPSF